jgi:predicted dithiol-disulfide oxidoreductase (DUF899 family)
MKYVQATKKLGALREKIGALRDEMRKLQNAVEPQPVMDYVFKRADHGDVRLSELFDDKDTLFVIHNMGASCPYCTLWADGFSGVYHHLNNRAAFVLSSPDAPGKQKTFAQSRGWKFPMISHDGTSFAADMGYRGKDGWMPGVSVFRRKGGEVVRVSDAGFAPGDDFCAVWHFFDLIPEGAAGWSPKYKYAS